MSDDRDWRWIISRLKAQSWNMSGTQHGTIQWNVIAACCYYFSPLRHQHAQCVALFRKISTFPLFFYISSFNLVIWLYIFFSKQISAIYWSPMQNVQYIIGCYGNCWDNQGAKEILSPYTFGNCHINATTALRRLFPLIMGTWVCCWWYSAAACIHHITPVSVIVREHPLAIICAGGLLGMWDPRGKTV